MAKGGGSRARETCAAHIFWVQTRVNLLLRYEGRGERSPLIKRIGRVELKFAVRGIFMDTNFLKSHADRCRSLAENADEFTKRRLLDLAANYDRRIWAAGPRPSAKHRSTTKQIRATKAFEKLPPSPSNVSPT